MISRVVGCALLNVVHRDAEHRGVEFSTDPCRPSKTLWFGFSPAVVLVTLALLVGGGVATARSGETFYRSEVAQVCEQSLALKKAQWSEAARGADGRGPFIFSALLELSELHSTELGKLRPTGGDVETHRTLVDGERRLATGLRAALEQYPPTLDPSNSSAIAGIGETLNRVYPMAQEQDRLYKEETGIEHCSD